MALDARTGRLPWVHQAGFRVTTALASERVVLALGAAFHDQGDRLWALEPASGHTLATTTVPSAGTTTRSTAEGSLWLASGAGELLVVPCLRAPLPGARATAHAHQRVTKTSETTDATASVTVA